jgi:hypothetical protein
MRNLFAAHQASGWCSEIRRLGLIPRAGYLVQVKARTYIRLYG